jgi:hypothetical protein
MSEAQKPVRLSGVETLFRRSELKVLKEHFRCRNIEELQKAALRYENLMFYFDYETSGCEPRPYNLECNMELALALCGLVFKDFRNLNAPLIQVHGRKTAGRNSNNDLPANISELMKETTKLVGTKAAAVRHLIRNGTIKSNSSPASVMRRIQILEKETREREEDFRRLFASITPEPTGGT